MSNLVNIRKNMIQNLEVDITIICQINNTELSELKINIRSTVFNLLLKE